jgi:hypothetical protein
MLSVVYKLMTDPDEFLKFFLKQFRKYMKGCIARCTVVVGTLRTGYHHVQASSQDNGSRLLAGGSFGAVTCLRGSGSHLPAQDSSGATTCPCGSGFCLPAQGCHVSPGLQHPPSSSGQLWSCHVSRGWALQAVSN